MGLNSEDLAGGEALVRVAKPYIRGWSPLKLAPPKRVRTTAGEEPRAVRFRRRRSSVRY